MPATPARPSPPAAAPSTRPKVAAAAEVKCLPDLLGLLNIQKWDYLIVGDGSATTWKQPGGWASVLIERRTGIRVPFHGSMSCCTNIVAELMAYFHPLMYLRSQLGSNFTPQQVHIVTDCQFITQAARRREYRKKHTELWAFFESCGRRGLQTVWHLIPRDTIDMNRFSHNLANIARKHAIKASGDGMLAALGDLGISHPDPGLQACEPNFREDNVTGN